MGRPYTGFKGNSNGKLPGTEAFKDMIVFLNGKKITNLGTWVVRNMNNPGNPNKPSIHGTGRAMDLGYGNDRAAGLALIDFLVKHSEDFEVEEIHDYSFEGGKFGRGWRCDRMAWKVYDKPTIGSPGGKWVHVELSPKFANDAKLVGDTFARIFKGK